MKRIISFAVTAAIMLAFVLTGCSQPAAQNSAAGGEASASAEEEVPDACGPVWAEVLNFKIAHATNYCGFLNEKLGITVGYAGEAHYTADKAATWPRAENVSMCLFGLDYINENLVWASGNGNNVRMSTDGGKAWKEKTSASLGSILSYVDFIDDKNGWVANLEKLAATSDGAMTWTEVALPKNAESIAAICLRTPQCGYLMTHSGLLFTTADGGATWSEKDLNLKDYKVADLNGNTGLNKKTIAMADISFADENNGTIVFAGMVPGEGFITVCLTTKDGGAAWVSSPVPDVGFTAKKVFLTSDGQWLTLGDDGNKTAVLKRQ